MKRKRGLHMRIAVLSFAWVAFCFAVSSASAMLPADVVYCRALGYQFFSAHTHKGVMGVCVLPDGRWVNAWDFYTGKVALEWSYCAREGYEARHDEDGPVCRNCTVCTLPTGEEAWMVRLMGLSFRESVCGDGHCGTAESFENCPADCPSGGLDAFCDGVSDRICDPDCVDFGGEDADCPSLFLDIKPGSCPNPLNLKEKGVLPVAILGTVRLKVEDIQPDSVRLSRNGVTAFVRPLRYGVEDVGTPSFAGDCRCWTVPGDRRPDLTMKFDAQEVIKKLNLGSCAGQTVPLTVQATLKDGSLVSGRDCIVIGPRAK